MSEAETLPRLPLLTDAELAMLAKRTEWAPADNMLARAISHIEWLNRPAPQPAQDVTERATRDVQRGHA